jgi:hypothetical protein
VPLNGLWAAVLLLVALVGTAASAAPAGRPIAVPMGWTDDVDPRARARVESWLDEDARAVAVLSTSARDEFAEVLAVIELPGALDLEAPRADELRRALPAGLGVLTQTSIEIDTIAPASVRGRGESGDTVYDAVLVPSGTTRRLVVLEVRKDELPLYRSTMNEALAGLTGVAAPIRPFSIAPWRWTAIVGWTIATALALTIALVRRPFGTGARTIGRVLALACLVLAAISAALVWTPLSDHSDALRLAGIGPTTLTAEIVSYGLIAALACWLVGTIVGRDEGRVASAPTSGAFADKSMSVPRLPIVPGPGSSVPDAPTADGPPP